MPSHGESELVGKCNSRSVVAIRSQKLGLTECSPVSSLDRQALEGPTAVLQTNPMNEAVNNGASLTSREGKAHSMVTPEPDKWDLDASRSSPTLEIPESPQLQPIPSPTLSPHRTDSPTLWWKDTEITGHDPKDPTDDGYGINGIGFIPTPAVEEARIRLRKRQLAEWKNREAKEARQRRIDRRRNRNVGIGDRGEILADLSMDEVKQVKKVRFLEA